MIKFFKWGILGTTPLTIYYISHLFKKEEERPEIDLPIILVSQSRENFQSSCTQYSSGAIGEGYQQTFNNSTELLTYLLKVIEVVPIDSVKLSLPSYMTPLSSKNWYKVTNKSKRALQSSTFFEYKLNNAFSSEDAQQTLKSLWKGWSANWDIKPQETRRTMYSSNRFDFDLVPFSPIQLYKCYGGMWYSYELIPSLSEIANLKKLHQYHLGIL